MNDQEFIELLNLYLDHEIGGEAAARLEAEVMQNPARRRTYEQYCRIHKACSLLAKAAPAAASDDGKVLAFDRAPHASPARYAAAGILAAAAAVAAVFFFRHPAAPAHAPAAAETLASAAPAAQLAAAPAREAAMDELQPVFSAREFSAAAPGAGPLWPTGDLAWMTHVQLPPVPPPLPPSALAEAKTVPASLSAQPTGPTAVDLSAFRFEK